MNKHFSAILEIMDTAEIVPNEIRLTEDRDILIEADGYFDDLFVKDLETYCFHNELMFDFSALDGQKYLIKNPKNV